MKEKFVKEETNGYWPPVVPAIKGRYGIYAKPTGYNVSGKKMEDDGYELKIISPEDEAIKMNEWRNFHAHLLENYLKYLKTKTEEQFKSVAFCLQCEPVPIVKNELYDLMKTPVTHVANLAETKMIKAYHDCGKGTAYIKNDHVIAFHYGYDQPENAPKGEGIECIKISLSRTQICFTF